MKLDSLMDRWTQSWTSTWMQSLILGLALILLGILILMMPELLSVLVAFCILFAGTGLLVFGWRLRRARRACPPRAVHGLWGYFVDYSTTDGYTENVVRW